MPELLALAARMPVAPEPVPDGQLPLGETRNLGFSANGKVLLQGIDLKLPAASRTVVMGANGAGKSVLLRLLHGLLSPGAGQVLWEGQALDEAARRRQAMVFQRPVLLRRSVAANIRFALRLRGRADPARVAAILDEVGLGSQGRQAARLLSGGEQQRLNLARALATGPRVLFLDEPTASLDPAATIAIESIVQRAHERGTKIVFVTHDRDQAQRLADDVIFLSEGRVTEHTSASSFFDHPVSQAAIDYLAGRLHVRQTTGI